MGHRRAGRVGVVLESWRPRTECRPLPLMQQSGFAGPGQLTRPQWCVRVELLVRGDEDLFFANVRPRHTSSSTGWLRARCATAFAGSTSARAILRPRPCDTVVDTGPQQRRISYAGPNRGGCRRRRYARGRRGARRQHEAMCDSSDRPDEDGAGRRRLGVTLATAPQPIGHGGTGPERSQQRFAEALVTDPKASADDIAPFLGALNNASVLMHNRTVQRLRQAGPARTSR